MLVPKYPLFRVHHLYWAKKVVVFHFLLDPNSFKTQRENVTSIPACSHETANFDFWANRAVIAGEHERNRRSISPLSAVKIVTNCSFALALASEQLVKLIRGIVGGIERSQYSGSFLRTDREKTTVLFGDGYCQSWKERHCDRSFGAKKLLPSGKLP